MSHTVGVGEINGSHGDVPVGGVVGTQPLDDGHGGELHDVHVVVVPCDGCKMTKGQNLEEEERGEVSTVAIAVA